ncbi:hypothetical protein [Asaia sp. As-1742]|uniref:hypothetical protein n=1 Tax=Asaia sp. As-1742 TaxID=2608325 RepID=UPI001962E404|nr:hypothetical protein [Asaia sp. As-1742]
MKATTTGTASMKTATTPLGLSGKGCKHRRDEQGNPEDRLSAHGVDLSLPAKALKKRLRFLRYRHAWGRKKVESVTAGYRFVTNHARRGL